MEDGDEDGGWKGLRHMKRLLVLGIWVVAAGVWAGERSPEDFVTEVTLVKAVVLPVIVGDRQAGTAKIDAGKTLPVVDVTKDIVLVEALGAVSPVPRDATDLAGRLKKVDVAGPTRRDLRDAMKHRFALVGMTPEQVIKILGMPPRQEKTGILMRWWYPIMGDVPRVNTMTIERGTPPSAPQIIPGGYRMFRGRDGVDYAIQEPPILYPGFFGESFQVRQETTEKAPIDEKLLVFENGRLTRVTDELAEPERPEMDGIP